MNEAPASEVTIATVSFPSGGLRCDGDLYTPAPGATGAPAIVLGHGFNMTREALKNEAAAFARAGFVALAIDYRSFGTSEGEPRGFLHPRNQVADLRNAVTFLAARDGVDPQRIGMWGASFAGGLVIYAAALDRRIKAVVSQSAITSGRKWMRMLRGGHDYEMLLDQIQQEFEDAFHGREPKRIPSSGSLGVEGSAIPKAPPGAKRPPADPANPVASPEANQRTYNPTILLGSMEHILDFSPEDVVELIAPRALLMIGNAGYDQTHFLTNIQDTFAKAREPKQLVLLPYDGIGLYQEPGLSEALGVAIEFFKRYLASPPS